MTYQMTLLDNGLRVASETLPNVESVSLVVSIGVGARYESEQENGVSHLLEHMAFKGTKTRNARTIAEAFDAIGGNINAFTSMECTAYYAKVLKEDVELAADILSDILLNSIFDVEELRREQDVIVQEIAMHRDAPDDLINDYFDEMAYPNQPLGRTILSDEERIVSYRRDDLIHYMNRHYRTPRMVLSAAGRIDHDTLVALAKRYFCMPLKAPGPVYIPAHYVGGDKRVTRDLEQLHLLFGLPAVSVHAPEFHAQQLFANILGGGMSSRLFQEVREKRGLAYTVYASSAAYEDCGTLSIYAATAPEKAQELSAILCDELVAMSRTVTEAELTRAKNQVRADLLMARESPQNVATRIGRHLLMFNEYRQVRDTMARINAVTVKDILALGERMRQGNPTVAALGNVSGLLPFERLVERLRA